MFIVVGILSFMSPFQSFVGLAILFGWYLIIKGMEAAIGAGTVTYDFARLTQGAKEVKCSEFGDAVIATM